MNETLSPLNHPMDDQTPGGVYMCQVGENVSCGACCGLYNVTDPSASNLTALLERRSLMFAEVDRTVENIDTFAAHIRELEPTRRPFDDFHHCPFIGLIGQSYQRVGCLLHPLGDGNDGVDYRGLSYYGGLACSTYFCASVYNLTPRYKTILRSVIQDWYRYGMLVTETKLLAAIFSNLESLIGGRLLPHHFTTDPQSADALIHLLDLKKDWPYRKSTANTICHHIFRDSPRYRGDIHHKNNDIPGSQFGDIIIELDTDLSNTDQFLQAEAMINDRMRHVIDQLGKTRHCQDFKPITVAGVDTSLISR